MSGRPKYFWAWSEVQGRVFSIIIVNEYGFCRLVLNNLTIFKNIRTSAFIPEA